MRGIIEVEGTNYEKMFPKWFDTNFLPMLAIKTLEVWMIYDFLNFAKNKYSVNQRRGCWMEGSCKLQYLVKTRLSYKDICYQHNRVKKFCQFYSAKNYRSMSKIFTNW